MSVITYDEHGRQISRLDPDPNNQFQSTSYNSQEQVDETRTYNNRNLVTAINNPGVTNATYTYDDNGNKLTETFDGVMASKSFTTQSGGDDGYDDEDRFMRFNQTGNNATFTRSDIGNISNVNLNGTGTARSYSNVHELTTIGGQTQVFDIDGNLATQASGTTLGWDDAGRLETANPSGGSLSTYGYDASGRRATETVGSTTTVFVYAGPNCIAEYASGTAAASPDVQFVYAQGIDSLVLVDDGTSDLAVLRNQQWSVTALVNNSGGSVVERYAYDHFGKRTIYAANGTTVRTASSHKNPYGYTSRRHDDSGLMYYRARYYDPETGEFISQDPLEYVDGMTQYRAYMVPNMVDPSGTTIILNGSSMDQLKLLGMFKKLCPSNNWHVDFNEGFFDFFHGKLYTYNKDFCKKPTREITYEKDIFCPLSGASYTSEVTETVEDPAPCASSGTPKSCCCICEAMNSYRRFNIYWDKDKNGGHWNPWTNGTTVGTYPGVPGRGASNPPAPGQVPTPSWLILGHELCGHALPKLYHPPVGDPTRYTDKDPVIIIENDIRDEHSTPTEDWGERGPFLP